MFMAREILTVSCLGYHTQTGKHGEWWMWYQQALNLLLGLISRVGNFDDERKRKRVGTMGENKDGD